MYKKILILIVLLMFSCPSFAREGIRAARVESGVWIFKIDTSKYKNRIKPHVEYVTPDELYKKGGYTLVVNGGFFDMENGNPVSYVVIDKETIETPSDNQKLMSELMKNEREEAVLNRTEFRILENKKGELSYDIAPHFKKAEKDMTIKHSLQGGPLLYPQLKWEEESFVTFDNIGRVLFESCNVTKKRPRTLLGIKGKNLYIIVFSKNHPVSLNEARTYVIKKIKVDKLMALDGGGSTAINYEDIKIFSEGKNGRKVKSFLVIEDEK